MLAESYLCNGHSVDEGEGVVACRSGVGEAASGKAEDETWTRGAAATSVVNGRHARKSSFQLLYSILGLVYIHDLN